MLAVAADLVLLTMGREVAEGRACRIQFTLADNRDADWWSAYDGVFDLVVSGTALHWLSSESLARTYRRAYQALKPGGWLMNPDHMASDSLKTQEHYPAMLRRRQQEAFRASGADDWDAFWDQLERAVGQSDLLELRDEAEYWVGSDDGQPRRFHLDVLRE